MAVFSELMLAESLQRLTAKTHFLIAYSGGLDSHVLLHSLANLKQQMPFMQLRAIHINHGLSHNALHWQQHCQHVCRELEVDIIVENIGLELHQAIAKGQSESLESLARDYRYQAMAQHLQSHEALLTAHTQNDQVETVLMRLFRGGGVKGLAAMRAVRPFATTELIRPFLTVSRDALELYAQKCQLNWVEDESNVNPRFDRNYIRQQLLPSLKQRWPQLVNNVCRTAKHMATADHLLSQLAEQDLARLKGSVDQTLAVSKLMLLDRDRCMNALRKWLQLRQLPLPSTVKLNQVLSDVLHCRSDANPLVSWRNGEIRRYRDNLYAMPPLIPHDTGLVIVWNLSQDLTLPNGLGQLTAQQLQAAGIELENNLPVTVRFRQGGERCRFPGQLHSQSLKKLLQQWQVPPWLRDRLPLIYVGDQLVWVVTMPHLGVDSRFRGDDAIAIHPTSSEE